MNKNKIIAILLPVLFLASCARDEKNIGTAENPLIIAFSKPYYSNLSFESVVIFEKYLSQKAGLIVKIKKEPESSLLLKDFGAGKTDIALLTTNEYLVARQDYKAKPILQVLRGKKETQYFAGIAVADKNIKTLDDLNGKKIGARDRYSMSGFILPSLFFVKGKIKPEFVFTGSHEESLKMLYAKQLDAVAVYEKMIKADKKLRLLQIMGPVPNEPFVCRKGLSSDLCDRIKDALMSFCAVDKSQLILKDMADITGLAPVNFEAYRDLHETILSSGKDIYSLIPGSINLIKINQPYYFD